MPTKGRKVAESAGALTVMAVGAILAIAGLEYGLVSADRPGNGLFPFVCGAILAGLSLGWLQRECGEHVFGALPARQPTDDKDKEQA